MGGYIPLCRSHASAVLRLVLQAPHPSYAAGSGTNGTHAFASPWPSVAYSERNFSTARGDICRASRPRAPGSGTLSCSINSTWFLVIGGFGKTSETYARRCHKLNGNGTRKGLTPALAATV